MMFVRDPLACPACGIQGLSVARRLGLGSARSVACRACDARISVGRAAELVVAVLGQLAVLGGGLAALLVVGTFTSVVVMGATFMAGALVGVAIWLWMSHRFVPLVVREPAHRT